MFNIESCTSFITREMICGFFSVRKKGITLTVTVTSNKTTSKKIKSLKAKKKYYVRVRTYKTVNGTKYYSGWSTKKYVTTKA